MPCLCSTNYHCFYIQITSVHVPYNIGHIGVHSLHRYKCMVLVVSIGLVIFRSRVHVSLSLFATNPEQAANLLCSQANSASYPQRVPCVPFMARVMGLKGPRFRPPKFHANLRVLLLTRRYCSQNKNLVALLAWYRPIWTTFVCVSK